MNELPGKQAYRHNILAARALAETIRTTLGPKGMDKMVVAADGSTLVTNDGVTILEAMNIPHPTGRMIVEASRVQDDEVGDGTTTVVVLAGELLKEAELLLEKGIHPSIIIRGYRLAQTKSLDILSELSQPINKHKQLALEQLALTAMGGKGVGESKQKLAKLVVEASVSAGSHIRDNLKLIAKAGGTIDDTQLVKGIVLEKHRLREDMPSEVNDAKIALVNASIEVRQTEVDSKISISSPEQMQEFINMEDSMLKELVNKLLATGANVVLCQKGIDDMAQHYFESSRVFALRRVSLNDMKLLSRATGGRIITELASIKSRDLGKADRVYEKKVGDELLSFVSGASKAMTMLVRGGTQHVAEEASRAIEDAVGDIASVMEDGRIVGGAGAVEMALAHKLNKFADSLPGREQLAVKAFTKALEIIPITLAENAGLDQISVLTALKSAHAKGDIYAGLDVENGRLQHTMRSGVIEPLKVKIQAINSAVEVATMILRIDDVIVNEEAEEENHLLE